MKGTRKGDGKGDQECRLGLLYGAGAGGDWGGGWNSASLRGSPSVSIDPLAEAPRQRLRLAP